MLLPSLLVVGKHPPPQLNSPCWVACVEVMALWHSLARYDLYCRWLYHAQYSPLLHSSFQAQTQNYTHPFHWNTVTPLYAFSRELAVLGSSLRLIIFIFSVISLVSRRNRASREGLEMARERWNGQVCFTTRSKTSWEVPQLMFDLLPITLQLKCM